MSLRNYRLISRTLAPFITCLAMFAITMACAAPAQPPKAISGPPKVAPDFSLLDSNGATLKLSEYKGKVVLLDFWATWCGGCRTEIPWYEEFERKYGASGFSAIGVAMDKSWKTVKPFMTKEKMNYPVVVGSIGLLKKYSVFNLPATFLVDRDGRIADYHVGVVNRDRFECEIKKLLVEKGS